MRILLHCFEERDGKFIRCAIEDATNMDDLKKWQFYHLQNAIGRVVIEEEILGES